MIGERNRVDAEEFFQIAQTLPFVGDLTDWHRTGNQNRRLGTEAGVVRTGRAYGVGVIPRLVVLGARFGLDPSFLQEVQCAMDVLVVQPGNHHQPVRQRSHAQPANLRNARATVHQNVVVRGLNRWLKGLDAQRPVREALYLEVAVEQVAEGNQPILRKVLQVQLRETSQVVACEVGSKNIQAAQLPELRSEEHTSELQSLTNLV